MSLKKQVYVLAILLTASMTMHLIYGLEGAKQVGELEYKLERQATVIKDKQEQIEVLEIMLEHKEDVKELTCLGEFTITHYCPCEICCGKTDGITFTGTKAVECRTIAVDPKVIPLGSAVIIDGQEYIAEDIGGAIKGNRLDVFMDSHQAALDAGVIQVEVYIGG